MLVSDAALVDQPGDAFGDTGVAVDRRESTRSTMTCVSRTRGCCWSRLCLNSSGLEVLIDATVLPDGRVVAHAEAARC